MRILSALKRFWYMFVIGEDWVIAASVIWGLAILSALQDYYMRAWFLLPLIVTVGLILSVQRGQQPKLPKVSKNYRMIFLLLAMLGIIVVPIAIFRVRTNDASVDDLFLPAVISAGLASIAASCLLKFSGKFPFTSSIAATSLALFIGSRLAPKILEISENFYNTAHALGCIVAMLAVGCLSVLAVALALSRFSPSHTD